jgi:prephenate dehydrogenase
MKHISIIGVGLIGGSLGMALKKNAGKKYHVTGVGRNPAKLKAAKRLGAVDAFTTDLKEGVKDADIIVICLPVHLITPTVKKILPFIKPGAVITDAGSVKGSIIKEVRKVLPASKRSNVFIGAHPMAGSERSGVKAARAELYKGATVVIDASAHSKAADDVIAMWKTAGAKIVRMNSAAHDRAVALISHLPHAMAFSLCSLSEKLKKTNPQISKLIAGSFKDMTRIADSNPADWASICGANKLEISKAIDMFIKELIAVKKVLKNTAALEKRFEKAKTARRKLINER